MRALLVIAVAVTSPVAARADMIDTSGMKPWETCALCHSLDGVSRMSKFPKLAGQPASYIEKQLHDFKSGARDNDGGQMEAIAADVSDEIRPMVAAYFAGLEPPPAVLREAPDPAAMAIIEKGDGGAVPPCMSCHGKDRTAASGAPRLEAQHADYVVKQLHDFRAGNRRNDPEGVMQRIAGALSEPMIEAIAETLAARERQR